MSSWESLGSPFIKGSELSWALPLSGRGGTLWLKFPAVAKAESASLGIGDDDAQIPTQLYLKTIELQRHAQIFKFEIPPALESPFFALKFSGGRRHLDVYYCFVMTFLQENAPVPNTVVKGLGSAADKVPGTTVTAFGTGQTFVAIPSGWVGESVPEFLGLNVPVGDPADPGDAERAPILSWSALTGASDFPPTDLKRVYNIRISNVGDDEASLHLIYIDDTEERPATTVTLAPGDSHKFNVGKLSTEVKKIQVLGYAEQESKLTAMVDWRWFVPNPEE